MSDQPPPERRWPRWVYGVGGEPDPRFSFANERTFLAWIRTGLGFLAAGVGVTAIARLGSNLGPAVRIVSALLIIAGLVCAVGAFVRWLRSERAIRLDQPLPSSPVLAVVSTILVVVAVAAVLLVTLR